MLRVILLFSLFLSFGGGDVYSVLAGLTTENRWLEATWSFYFVEDISLKLDWRDDMADSPNLSYVDESSP